MFGSPIYSRGRRPVVTTSDYINESNITLPAGEFVDIHTLAFPNLRIGDLVFMQWRCRFQRSSTAGQCTVQVTTDHIPDNPISFLPLDWEIGLGMSLSSSAILDTCNSYMAVARGVGDGEGILRARSTGAQSTIPTDFAMVRVHHIRFT